MFHPHKVVIWHEYVRSGKPKHWSDFNKEAKEEGKIDIEWNVLDWNAPAIEFYEKSGAKVFKDWLVAQMDEKGIDAFLEKNKI